MFEWLWFAAHQLIGSDPVTQFLSAPTLFTAVHALRPNPVGLVKGINTVTIDSDMGLQARKADGSLSAAYELRLAQPGEKSFQIFWCPYIANTTKSVMIDAAADFLFTATMDGCSLGIGNRTPQGGYLISHANRADKGLKVMNAGGTPEACGLAQRASQAKAIARKHQGRSQHVDVIAPDVYMLDPDSGQLGLQSTTFGVRNTSTDRWVFYCQRSEQLYSNPVNYRLLDLLPILET